MRLDPLVAIAKAHAITVVVILHLNKSESKDFTARVAESHGFQALARCVLALGPDPDDTDGERGSKKVLAITKANLAGAGNHALRCEVQSAMVYDNAGHPIATSELALIGKADIGADDLLMSSADRSARVEAAEWLDEFVGDRWVKVADIRKAAMADGWSWRTIERVRQAGGYQRANNPESRTDHGGLPAKHHNPYTPVRATLAALATLRALQRPRPPRWPVPGTREGDLSTAPTTPTAPSPPSPPRTPRRQGSNLATSAWEQRRLGERDDDDEDPGA
jgi:hypothetical protein